MSDYQYELFSTVAFLLYCLGYLNFPTRINRLAFNMLAGRENQAVLANLAGISAVFTLHFATLQLARLDPIDPVALVNGTANLFRFGAYPMLGWLPIIPGLAFQMLEVFSRRYREIP